MMDMDFYSLIQFVEEFIWILFGFPIIVGLGLLLSIKSRFVQVRRFPHIIRTFWEYSKVKDLDDGTVHPLKAFFAAVGGCIGIGNLVAICTAIQIGGPGALFWIWLTAAVGVTLKYAEVYLGIRYRVPNEKGGYNGGPMYFIPHAIKGRWAPFFLCLFLCIYGVEIYQFSVITTSVSTNFDFNLYAVITLLIGLVIYACSGGVSRVGAISSVVVPLFVVLYVSMGLYVMAVNWSLIPGVLYDVFSHAFSGHAAVGGFIGSTILLTITQGIRRGCYTGDIGVGYASVIYSESSDRNIARQASMVMIGIFLDTFIICTVSIMLILVTGIWSVPMDASLLVQTALGKYFPYMHYFMPFFLFLLGYSTINAYFVVGLKCANYIAPRWGTALFYLYAISALFLFALVDSSVAQSVMMIFAGLLIMLNGYAIFKLRDQISFDI